MTPSLHVDADEHRKFRILWEIGDRVFCRGQRRTANGEQDRVLVVLPATEHPTSASLDRLAHEYSLKDELDGWWAVRPLELARDSGPTMLVLEDTGGEPLDRQLGAPMEIGRFLQLTVGIVAALAQVHRHGLVHKDIKPANIMVNSATGEIKLTGFGIATRLPRERQAPEPPETVAGTLAYMAPEQTGRMNRSIDARSDLYAVGVTLYQMLTGSTPFTAADPMEWVHCHIARKAVPPSERLSHIPVPISNIVMKLLAKTPEKRYQTAGGVERDLRRCLAESERRGSIGDFPLGQQDTPDRLLIPEKLYGREREVETLLAAFDRIIKGGAPELVLVSGYSGIGKSSVVNELHKALVPSSGLFAAGKFDRYKRDIPYATLAQAFQSLVRPLLGKSDTELGVWRDRLVEALAPNGRLMVELVPELKLIIGEQPAVPELRLQDAQKRFQMVLRRFIGVFARPEHPLALFLDDLQWLDTATLEFLEDLLTRSDQQHLMLIGAYRDNEVSAVHPLMRTLDAIKAAGGKVAEITLAPLAREHVGQLIADAFRCEPARVAPLAELVHEKTNGNPFFAIRFVTSLAEDDLLGFDHDVARWSWDIGRIHAKGYTDNVVDLMIGELARLPQETQTALQQLACIGNTAELATLCMVLQMSADQVHAALWAAVRLDLVERQDGTYKFLHDRIQEAAYALIPADLQAEAHLRIGRLLAAHTPPEKREEAIFEIVNQLNRGALLITDRDERRQLAELDLIAGKRAKASTAYASALTYFAAGCALLPDDCWTQCYDLTFPLEFHRAECEFLTGALGAAEERLAALSDRARLLADFAAVTSLRVSLYTTLDRSDRAVEVCLDYLRRVGIQWSAHPTKAEVEDEYARIWRQLGKHPIEELADLPVLTDPQCRTTLDVLAAVQPAALFTDENLLCLVIGRMANLSLERGNSDGSCFAYVWLGAILGWRFGDYRSGYRFGKLGVGLVERRGLDRFKARARLSFANVVSPWSTHVRNGLDWLQRAFDAAEAAGDLTFAGYARNTFVTFRLAAGDPLADVQREAELALDFVRKTRFGLVADMLVGPLRLIRSLRGLNPDFPCVDDTGFDEDRFEQRLEAAPHLGVVACRYAIRKLQARFFAGDHVAAAVAAAKAARLLWTSRSFFEAAEFHFYAALTHAALCEARSGAGNAETLEAMTAHHRHLRQWAETCPENFRDRAALVGAEMARIEGHWLDAERLYEEAIGSARANGFVHNEALAYELAARFYAARGFDEFARVYLRNARYGYIRWGADGKVRQLDELYPYVRDDAQAAGPMSTIGAPVEHLDLATVIRISQAVSSEIVFENLIDTLMRTAIEQAGAERVLLILARSAAQRIAAEAMTGGDRVTVHVRDEPVAATALPESVLHYVLRTRESVILDDAMAQDPYSADPYIRNRQARSILCLPLLNHATLIGVLYLENNLAPRVFAPSRVAVLRMLASQAAISLENTRLYRELGEREARIRRLVDANIVGIFIWDLEGAILEANEAFLRIVGYDRADLASGRMRWTELTPPEWRDRDAQEWLPELKRTGRLQPLEKEYFRKDGSRVPVLIGSAIFEDSGREAVAFVLDLTDRNRAAEALQVVETELAHANRLATMGQLTASIAHEVKQPIAATVTTADAALRWLAHRPPNLDEVRHSLTSIIRHGTRAGDVVDRIRALIKKAPSRKDRLDINGAIREVIDITRGEAVKNGVRLQMELGNGLPVVEGDRVQLQQVILNLIMNAVEAMGAIEERDRTLLVSTGRDAADGVLVSVRDSGPGLDAESADRLFEAFYTTKPNGIGMGLAICRSIVEAHGGRMWAGPARPRGAILQFTLPSKTRRPAADIRPN